jgi:hypothetical protein
MIEKYVSIINLDGLRSVYQSKSRLSKRSQEKQRNVFRITISYLTRSILEKAVPVGKGLFGSLFIEFAIRMAIVLITGNDIETFCNRELLKIIESKDDFSDNLIIMANHLNGYEIVRIDHNQKKITQLIYPGMPITILYAGIKLPYVITEIEDEDSFKAKQLNLVQDGRSILRVKNGIQKYSYQYKKEEIKYAALNMNEPILFHQNDNGTSSINSDGTKLVISYGEAFYEN